MDKFYQPTFTDIYYDEHVNKLPRRTAYVDESGGYGFNFENEGNSKYYILCAVVIEDEKRQALHEQFEMIKKAIGIKDAELKSSRIKESSRIRILSQILTLPFRLVLFIADKQKFLNDSPLRSFKAVFVKNMAKRLYNLLYQAYPKLSIIQDETGTPEFKESFKKYVAKNRNEFNLFNQYDFDLVNSKDCVLVQLADFIAGSIMKHLNNPQDKDYLELLRGKITKIEYFPNEREPYWGKLKPEDCHYDSTIFDIAIKCATDFINKYTLDKNDDRRMQVGLLTYLIYYVKYVNPTKYVYADELIEHLSETVERKVVKNVLFRRVVAPLRDEGVILASCNKGYKIPISEDDLVAYLNSTTSIVRPMVDRMGKCRELIKRGTDNKLDLFENPAFIRYKRYFDEIV